jgi:hypothetical protein
VTSRDPREGIGLAARVILHLSELRRPGPNDVAGVEGTQQGMVAAFDVRQSSLVKVLKALLAGDVVAVEHRFVGGGANRRMQVYYLTPVGVSAARDLRRAEALTPTPKVMVSSEWVAPRAPGGSGPATDPAAAPRAAPRAGSSTP